MLAVFAEQQEKHYPEHFLVNGVMRPNPERPERCAMLLQGAQKAGCTVQQPQQYGLAPLQAIHSTRYLQFLQHAWRRWQHIDGAAPAVTPNIHPTSQPVGYPASVVAQAGFHMADMACPIAADSWESICWSAWTAVEAAQALTQGNNAAYALCRPPGHHAFAETAGGFCFLNNTAIAAQVLREKFSRVAILDVDLHHGNGTQGIFYARNDVFTVSLHAHPERFYPFFWGYENEAGEGNGVGFNLNLPLPRGAGDAEFMAALEPALEQIRAFQPHALVIALGLDAYADDPFAGLSISTAGFHRMAAEISRALPVPTLMVQEGGYPCPDLGDNLHAFLTGITA